MKIAPELLAEIVAHAQENPRIECCGVVAVQATGAADATADGAGRVAAHVYRAENVHASALKFEIAPMELYRLNEEIEERGWEIGAIYHSHVRSAPYPSQTDIGFAAGWPGLEWIIVGLASGEQPEVRSYLIEGADVREVPIDAAAQRAAS
jgi:[CysO sulfur-carrier protein]-S-L-cysteine hydrolase